MKYMYDVRQFDCIDSSRNTTSLIPDQLNMLRHHDVDLPESRGYMFDGRPPHATAVLVEKGKHQVADRLLDRAMDSLWRSCRWSALD